MRNNPLRPKTLMLMFLAFHLGAACRSSGPTAAPVIAVDVAVTPSRAPDVTCADLDRMWAAANWADVLAVLNQLETLGLTCGSEPLSSKRYAAHINYAITLEGDGKLPQAIEQYQTALAQDGRGREALEALIRLNTLPPPTLPPCYPNELAPYTPTPAAGYADAHEGQLWIDKQPFLIRGVNYYPRHSPWGQFLEGDPVEIAKELDLIASAGFNTVRVFLWYDPLFTCAPEEAVPNAERFAWLDALIAAAQARGLRLIVTLNDLPDIIFRPLYTDWARYDAQTAFLVARYRDEPAILAWDLRNEGDIDYGAQFGVPGKFARATVLDWLTHAAEVVRANDDRHLLTAGWWGDAAETVDVVDVVSFHHWADAASLASRIERLHAITHKPILLEEVGYPSAGSWDEAAQAEQLRDVLETAERGGVAGWLVWTAFDFQPTDILPVNVENHFGLWRLDLTPKPALQALPFAP